MTSSDETLLPAGAVAGAAARVGTSVEGVPSAVAGAAPSVAVLCAKFNGGITDRLLQGVLEGFAAHGLDASNVTVAWVPGAFELPVAALAAARSDRFSAVIALGAVIRGDTAHFEFVAGECAAGLQRVALATGVPVMFGVLTTETVAQALERSDKGAANKGYEAAVTALEMIGVLGALPARPR
ncbi:MAG: 6,7-dimethyl-8-ribityllumazine synthase [Acidimicrobiales bacterium]